ncbi:dTDP-4-dehydrorhamnose reductase [Hasllibacter halocynthiae]|uniref:dTDP-4-dehydrorhamnose reductase n=1 Tax=Hasllibacter halocynthiae TaxID=595589 RepID=A0A2T0X330_9RHOB|nr:dTDP-4-dehydrorhamnose reductase [Hasllibacter halocynthiae]PRY93305.1 dTDP-4-dehydrorhamnose reductase [Hasllibacter halocynthiae]
MRVLVFGRTGQLAREIGRADPSAVLLGREEADLRDPEGCARAVAARGPDAVIVAAAWTDVDGAEAAETEARVVNAAAPAAIARAAAAMGAPVVHVSTDYVFPGDAGPYAPDDPTGPPGAYGRTKLLGETAVRAAGGAHAILRTAWVFSAHGRNFVRTMLRLGAEREVLRVVDDQRGGPTPAAALANACLTAAAGLRRDPALSGTYHYAGAPDVTWAAFARAIMEEACLPARVEGIPSSAYGSAAARPLDSRLDCRTTEEAFGLQRPDWRAGLGDVVREERGGA